MAASARLGLGYTKDGRRRKDEAVRTDTHAPVIAIPTPTRVSAAWPKALPKPLYMTPPLSRNYLTWGPAVIEMLLRLFTLNPLVWQREVINRALEVDPKTRRLRYAEVLVGTGRQSGKTFISRAFGDWALTESPIWRVAVSAASTLDQAHRVYDPVSMDINTLDGWESTRHYGIRNGDGSRSFAALAGNPGSWRGISVDLAILDEVREQPNEEAYAALVPTTNARPEPMLLYTSTAGGPHSVLLHRMYEHGKAVLAGRSIDQRFGMFWWEARSEEVEAGIREANPALVDGLVSMDRLKRFAGTASPAVFQNEVLNRWADTMSTAWCPPGTWEACGDPLSVAPNGPPSFAVDVAPSWSRASIAVAVLDPDADRIHVEIAREWPDLGASVPEAEVIAEVRRMAKDYPKARFAYDPQSAIATAMKRLGEEGLSVVPVGGIEFRQACGSFLGHVVNGRLRHRADPVLDSAARLAARSVDAEAWRFIRRKSVGYIDALCAATLAVHLATQPPPPVPGVF